MTPRALALRAGAQAEAQALVRAPLAVVALTLGALLLLVALLLFARTGSEAPVALVDEDHSAESQAFTDELAHCHHAFALRRLERSAAAAALAAGALTGTITLPHGFGATLAQGGTAAVTLTIDNIDQDLSEDLRRSLPSAVVAFGLARHLPGITCRLEEHDRYARDTDYIAYLGISGATLGKLLVAAAAAALAAGRDREDGLWRLLTLAPAPLGWMIAGRVLVALLAAAGATVVADLTLVVAGVHVDAPGRWVATQLLAGAVGGSLGAALGLACRHTLTAVSAVLLAMPALLACSNTLEPQRFDGPAIGALAHLSPGAAVVALSEAAAHHLRVTAEGLGLEVLQGVAWIALGLLACRWALARARQGATA